MAIDRSLVNVILLGLAFMLVFTSFQTMGNIQKTIVSSINKDDPSFDADGYISLAIIYAVFSLCNWIAPSVISLIGPKFAMIFGGVTYLLFIMSFLLPKTWLLYFASVVIGVGAAMIWTGQGNYLTLNSTHATISRNSGIFWAMLQLSLFIGNIFVYFQFQGKDVIDKDTRFVVQWTLSGIAMGGILVLAILPPIKRSADDTTTQEVHQGPLEALKGAGRLFITKDMLLLSITFFYTGIELGFFSGVYSSAIGYTQNFPSSKELVGLSGIFIGVGEVLGGAVFGILGAVTKKIGRDPIVIGGFVLHVISFFLIFLNLPNDSPFDDTHSDAFITSNAPLAIFCSFMLGLGDACYNTQIYALLGDVYSKNSAPAFAIFKFTQSVAAAACFFYASALVLYGQLGILLILSIIGTASFVWVEWSIKKQARKIPDSASSTDGIALGFFTGVYGSAIGYTHKFPSSKELVGLSGIFMGIGEVLGGAVFGILGTVARKLGRDSIVIGGFVLHVTSFFLIFLNLPNDSPFDETYNDAIITSNAPLAIFCSFMLGLGDACYNTQIYAILGDVYSRNSAPAFAIYKFTQSVGASACFLYATSLVLYGQLAILLILSVLGTASYVWVERSVKKQARKIADSASSADGE